MNDFTPAVEDPIPERLIRKLEQRDELSEAEKATLRNLPLIEKSHAAFETLARFGDHPTTSKLLLSGFICRCRDLTDGGRQIMSIHVPGDFLDLQSFPLKVMDHDLLTLSPVRVGIVAHEDLNRVTEAHPHLTRLLWMATLIDAAIHREWLVTFGRREAVARAAHLLCEIYLRLNIGGLTRGYGFDFPLNQSTLADMLGLSTVHTNRVVQRLRATGLVSWDRGRVEIRDWDGLVALAEFDATYLHLEKVPR